MIYVWSDGSNTKAQKTRCAVIIKDNAHNTLYKEVVDGPTGWCDVAEYQSVVNGLAALLNMGLEQEQILWRNDASFVMGQMSGQMKVQTQRQEKRLNSYYPLFQEAQRLVQNFRSIHFQWIPREQNTEADALSKL